MKQLQIQMLLMVSVTSWFLNEPCYAQNSDYSDLPLKESYDALNRRRVLYWFNDPLVTPLDDADAFGDGMAYVLESYIILYDVTKDRGYLDKFIVDALRVLSHRHDLSISSEERAYWSPSHYHNGNIAAAFARFAHYIRVLHPEIGGIVIFPHPALTSSTEYPWCVSSGEGCETYADFAKWIGARADETIDDLLYQYWVPGKGVAKEIGGDRADAFNFQAGIAKALIFMAGSDPSTYYAEKADEIALMCKAHLNWSNPCQGTIDADVMREQSGYALWWYHGGWSIRNTACWSFPANYSSSPDIEYYLSVKEDLTHGATVSQMMLDLFRNGPRINESDIVRLHNTFTKHVFEASTGEFHRALDGTDGPIFQTTLSPFAPLGFAHLAPYDGFDASSVDLEGVADDVYSILMEFAIDVMIHDPVAPSFDFPDYSGGEQRGHADLVAAQWQRECFDLSLYNRNLVYDQDFFAKGELTIDPSGGPGPSFADPVINEPVFIVRDGVTSTMRAGASILFEPGFEVEPGAVFEAYIDPAGCAMSSGLALQTPPTAQHAQEGMSMAPGDLVIPDTPTPPTERTSITLSTDERRAMLKVSTERPSVAHGVLLNELGAVVQTIPAIPLSAGNQIHTLDFPDVAPGIYLLRIIVNDRAEHIRMFLGQ